MLDIFIKGGFLMYPILFCSMAGIAVIIAKALQYRDILKHIKRPLSEVIKKRPPIVIPLFEVLKKTRNEEEIMMAGTKQVRLIEEGLSWLGIIATVAPLIGLTGTVIGMIKAFMVIANSTHVNPSMLAGGIWEALITTGAGLIVAIPIHIGHHYLEKQADEIAFVLKEITLGIINDH